MHGLVTLLPSPFYEQVEELWKELAQEHDLYGIHVTPYPHFSWQIAMDYNFTGLEADIRQLTSQVQPFTVRTAGLGIFSGLRPVIYIGVVKDKKLLDLHNKIWDIATPYSQQGSPLYSPQAWMPHISLAYEDVNHNNIGRVMEKLAFQSFIWEMEVDNISLIFEPDGEIGGLKFRAPFSQTATHPPKETRE